MYSWHSKLKALLQRIAFVLQYYSKKIIYHLKRRLPDIKRLHLNSFPAVHLKKLDALDYGLKFSNELLVCLLTVLVAGLNIYFFRITPEYADKSYTAKLLSYHYALNSKLYYKLNTIKTVVSKPNLLVAAAYADDSAGIINPNNPNESPDPAQNNSGQGLIINDNSLVAPSPDTLKSAVINVVKKIYTTEPGDTLASIAAANNISVNSIVWSNPNLTGTTIKPGWDLIIPPVSGVAVTADANTTLPDLAAKYNPQRYNTNKTIRDQTAAALLDTIINYNGLDSAEDINPGDFLIIPGGVLATAPTPPAPKAKPKTVAPDNSLNTVTSISSGYDDVNHLFPKGYCTYYVATRMKITFGGNAKNWLANAKASGYVTGQEPAPRSAVVMTGPKGAIRRYGHVAYVESVNDNNTITISEMNFDHFNRIDTRTLSVNDSSIRGYIYQ